jgi:hypothetical protein
VTDEATLVPVHLRGLPLDIRARSQEHEQDLMRELALVRVSAATESASNAPGRLLDLADELRSTYGSLAAGPDALMEAAVDRGETAADVTYTVPADLRPFLRRTAQVLEEAEEFCRDGRYLLTLAAPPDVAAYRAWIFAEFDRQIAGGDPVPWPESVQARGVIGDG